MHLYIVHRVNIDLYKLLRGSELPKGPLMQETQSKKDWQDLSMLNAIQ